MEKNATMCEAKGGKETVPVDLILTVVAMWVVSLGGLFYIFKRGWMHYELVTPQMMQHSYVTSTLGHGLYRMIVAIYSFSLIMVSVHLGLQAERVGWDLRFFTVWNYTTLCLVFMLLSCQHVFTHVPKWVSNITWTLFQVELANVFFLDFVFWAILFPKLPPSVVFKMPEFFITVNVHAINAILMLGEVYLGQVLVVPGQIAWVALYALAYIVFTWINYSTTNACLPYPFLAVSTKTAPEIYVGMCAFMSFIFLLTYKLVQLKERLFTGSSVSNKGYIQIA